MLFCTIESVIVASRCALLAHVCDFQALASKDGKEARLARAIVYFIAAGQRNGICHTVGRYNRLSLAKLVSRALRACLVRELALEASRHTRCAYMLVLGRRRESGVAQTEIDRGAVGSQGA